jgi:plasmid replication initiation protein
MNKNTSMVVTVTDKRLVIQHNKIVEAKYKLSVGEQRLIKFLVSIIEKDDDDFKPYRLSVSDLAGLLEIKRKDYYKAVKDTTRELIGKVLTFESTGRTIQAAWLASADYHDGEGFVELQFAPVLKPLLLHLKSQFTKYELGNVIRLKHTHSIRLYELLKQYEVIGKRRFLLDELRGILMIEINEYIRYRDFRRWVLQVAQKELSEKTDISFEWKEEKIKRVCFAIEFIIKSQDRTHKKNRENIALGNDKDVKSREDEPCEIEKSKPIFVDDAVSRLVSLGVIWDTAEKLVQEYDEDRIKAAIAYTQAQHNKGKLNNLAGFVVEAVKSGYLDSQAEGREKKAMQETNRLAAQKQEAETKRADAEKRERDRADMELSIKWFEALPESEKKAIESEYLAESNAVDIGGFKKSGYNYIGFRFFAKKKWKATN